MSLQKKLSNLIDAYDKNGLTKQDLITAIVFEHKKEKRNSNE